MTTIDNARIFQGNDAKPHDFELPPAPPWRQRSAEQQAKRGEAFKPSDPMIKMVNAALLLRRPLLITGKPGTGKSSLIYAVARELQLGRVLRWPVTSRSTLKSALYEYDAIGRMQDATLGGKAGIGNFIRLGPLGTALIPAKRPRALLIDEIDKADIDLPNDLLDVFEEGEFEIPELSRLKDEDRVNVRTFDGEHYEVENGRVQSEEFPFVILTSNGERDFAPAFLRRCLQLDVTEPDADELTRIVRAHLAECVTGEVEKLIRDFVQQRNDQVLSTDQLLNAVFLIRGVEPTDDEIKQIKDIVLKPLGSV
ncbi:MoxR family ATPase [Paraburkholderia sp. D15]|uniref:AAA family ATPase n=1 Tax=Paraburkholderia sp. D15 TaxID=2880218 RepID=UPI002478353D|nr:MoxR family ATPase [Paraburkholderia sp. D15]WGS53318.1 MoxR family ATPase [Paraburkholderia sp. D15]